MLIARLLLVATAYAVLAFASQQLAIAPGFASPFWLPAGVGLVAVLLLGPRGLIGVFIGALPCAAHQFYDAAASDPELVRTGLWAAPALALAATAQALLGARMVHRWVGYPDPLDTPRSIARFMLLAAPATGLLGAALVIAVLLGASALPLADAMVNAATLWVGQAVGIAVASPIALALFARPRPDWDTRRIAIVAPLLLALAVVGVAMRQLARFETDRVQAAFDREAQLALSGAIERIQGHLSVLDATHAFISASRTVDIERFSGFAQHWFPRFGAISAIGMSTRVQRNERETFEATIRGQSPYDFQIMARETDGRLVPATEGDEHFAITYIEPRLTHRRTLGLDQLSIPEARDAIDRAIRLRGAAATQPFRIRPDGDAPQGVAVFRPFYRSGPELMPAQADRWYVAGMSFVVIRPDRILEGLDPRSLLRTEFCLSDVSPGGPVRLAGAAGCERSTALATLAHRTQLQVGDRQWRMSLTPKTGADAPDRSWAVWGIGLTALLSMGLLSSFLLAVSGRARRTDAQIAARTLELRREIAERKSALVALTESEQRLRDMFDTAPVGLCYTALDGRVQRTNPRFGEITGCAEVETRVVRIVDVLHPDDRDTFIVGLLSLIGEGNGIYQQEARCQRPDGTTVPVEILVSLHRDTSGEPRQAVVAMQDISPRLELVAAQRAREAAEAASSAKTQFLSRISHELRTPLNALLGFAQLLRMDTTQQLAPRQDEHVRHIEQAGWHLLNMINDVLDLSRIEAGSVRIELQDIELQPVLEECQRLLRDHYSRCMVSLDIRVDDNARCVRGDPTRVRQVLTNLLDNAAKYNRQHGHVEVTTRLCETGDVVISVRDEGLGLSRRQREHLFEPFNRLGREHLNAGTGIGLVITRHLVEMMGGSISVASIEGRGSIFAVTLANGHRQDAPAPRSPAQSLSSTRAPAMLAASPRSRSEPARDTIVYIEDNRLNAMLVREMITQHTRYRVELFEDAEDALPQLSRLRPALVLLDLNLPGMDGLSALAKLRMDPATADIPVVIVSADAMPERIEHASELGADAYLTKPLRLPEFSAMLERLLGRPTSAGEGTELMPVEAPAPRADNPRR